MVEPFVDVAFQIRGRYVPLDHGYSVFGAVSRVVPHLHNESRWGIHPIYGRRIGPGRLLLMKQSALTLRAPSEHISMLLALAGKNLDIAGTQVLVGVPRIFPLRPHPVVRARFVTVKKFKGEPDEFEQALRRQLRQLDIGDSAHVKIGSRRVMKVGGHTVVGFQVAIESLAERDSLRLQVSGLGGRRHMGAGVFLASSDEDA